MFSAQLQGLFLSSSFPGRNMMKVQAFIAGVFEGGIRMFCSLLIAITSVALIASY